MVEMKRKNKIYRQLFLMETVCWYMFDTVVAFVAFIAYLKYTCLVTNTMPMLTEIFLYHMYAYVSTICLYIYEYKCINIYGNREYCIVYILVEINTLYYMLHLYENK